MRSLIDLVGRRRAAGPPAPEPARKAGGGSEAAPPGPGRAETGPANPGRTATEPPRQADTRPVQPERNAARSAESASAETPPRDPAAAPTKPAEPETAVKEPRKPAQAERADPERVRRETAAGPAKASTVDGSGTGGDASDPAGDPADGPDSDPTDGPDGDPHLGTADGPGLGADDDAAGDPAAGAEAAVEPAARARTRLGRGRRLPVVLGVVTVLLGGTAAWCADQANRVREASGGGNVALTDVAATSDVKGVVTDAVNTIFSFDYADMARTQQAADHVLTGDAVRQYDAMVAQVRAQAPRQKLVLTTTVTDSAVEILQGGRARLLLFADQRSTRTATKDTTYAAAMLAVDAVRRGGNWKISAIDTLTGRR